MEERSHVVLPRLSKLLKDLGGNIKLARLRRKLSGEMVAERAGVSRTTLQKIERGEGGVAIGLYLQVLLVLGLEEDLRNVASDDVLGRKLQDGRLLVKQRAPKRPR
jgi:transcriptional regulator with XRE-family HTH domain